MRPKNTEHEWEFVKQQYDRDCGGDRMFYKCKKCKVEVFTEFDFSLGVEGTRTLELPEGVLCL